MSLTILAAAVTPPRPGVAAALRGVATSLVVLADALDAQVQDSTDGVR